MNLARARRLTRKPRSTIRTIRLVIAEIIKRRVILSLRKKFLSSSVRPGLPIALYVQASAECQKRRVA